jgi:cell division protein ZapB
MINDFQNGPLCVDAAGEFQYRENMDSELSTLEDRIAQLVQRMKALREENGELRQQLATKTDENARIGEKLQAAKTRIEALLKQIPETET